MTQAQTPALSTLGDLVRAAVALGAEEVPGWSEAETALVTRHVRDRPLPKVDGLRARMVAGEDPLGTAFAAIRSPEQRRPLGQTYTPAAIVTAMIDWTADQGTPARVIDPGAGSGRYIMAAAARFRRARLVATDIDPVATLMSRAALAAVEAVDRAYVILGDYRSLNSPSFRGRTAYVGNPPYVRHHQIDQAWKKWLLETARRRGISASGLAGLHVHFFLATAEHGTPGDVGAFITSAEWLDVNYGTLVRDLLLDGLGGTSLHVLEPEAAPFADATTTGAITCFRLGSRPKSIKIRRVKDVEALGRLNGGRLISRQRLAEANRWSVLTRVTPKIPEGFVELGELCRVHRGTVTGANSVWVTHRHQTALPESVLFPSVTKARELFAAGERLADPEALRRVINLPADLDALNPADRKIVERFLRAAKQQGVHEGYIASMRKAWWRVGLREPAPILTTYMARRPPAFVRNDAAAHHINIAHGLYPREMMTGRLLDRLAAHLRTAVTQAQGRTYAGGLTKFEPKEVERLTVPSIEMLASSS